jgi:S-methylmethionine-dependent homocysteine/selenocysteine methylase
VLDGPLGTVLVRRGVALPAPGWSAHALDVAPDVVAAIHRDYVAAGATVHTTNTFRTKRRRWIDAGASIVGGCCGTEPAHIAHLAHCTARE